MYGLVTSRVASATSYGDVVVRQSENAWGASNTSGGTSSYVLDATAPYGYGSLQMTTPSGNDNSKATRTKVLSPNVKLSDITTLSYWTKQVTASNPTQTISLQLTVNGLTGTTKSTTLVFEPYWNVAGHVGVSQNLPNGVWQQWNVKDGIFWSTTTYTTAGLVKGAGGPPFYTLAQVIANNPNAKVTSIVANIGTYNPGNVSLVDGVNFNGTVYDFEPTIVAPVAPTITTPVEGEVISNSTGSATITWNPVSGADSYLLWLDDSEVAQPVSGTSITKGLTPGAHKVKIQSVAQSGLQGGTSAPRNFTVVIPDTEKPTGSATYSGGYLNTTTGVRYVQKIEDLSFTVNATDNKGVARAIYFAKNVDQPGVEACGNWNASSLTNYNFPTPLQQNATYIVSGNSIKACDPGMQWASGSRYNFFHAVFDEAGNMSETFNSPNQLVEIDKTQPVIQIISPLAGSTVNGVVPVEVRVIENGSGIEYVNAHFTDGPTPQFGNTALTLKPGTADVYVGSIDTTGKNGKFSLGVSTRDNVKNTRSAKAQNITIDNTPPAVPYDLSFKMSNGDIRPSGGWANLYKGDITWKHDNPSDVKNYVYYYWNDISTSPWKSDPKWSNPNIYYPSINGGEFTEGQGRHFFCVAAVDAVGNESACSQTFEIGYDKTDPTATITAPTGPVDTTKPFTIKGSFSDNLSGVGRLSLYISKGNTPADPAGGPSEFIQLNIPESQLNSTAGNFSHELTPTQISELSTKLGVKDGDTITILANVHDKANNSSNTSITFVADTKAPTAEINLDKTLNPTKVKVLASDGENMLYKVAVSITSSDGGGVSRAVEKTVYAKDFELDFAGPLAENSWQGLVDLPDGKYTVRATAFDMAGNHTDADSVDFTIDTKAPAVPAITTATPTGASGTAEPNSTVEVFVNGVSQGKTTADANGAWSLAFQSPFIAPGTFVVTAQATDEAGNTSDRGEKVFVVNAPATQVTPPGPTLAIEGINPTPGERTTFGLVGIGNDGAIALDGAVTDSPTEQQAPRGEVKSIADSRDNQAQVKGATDEKAGINWLGYWWILPILLAIGAGWWLIAGRKKRRQEEAEY